VTIDIAQEVARIAGVEPFPGLSSAWRWSPTPRFTFALALNRDGDAAFQVNALESFDEDLVRAVLEFSRLRGLDVLSRHMPLNIELGFRHADYEFDAVATARPEVHGYHVGRNELLNEFVVVVFPAFRCEISGTESMDEALLRFKRALRPTLLKRDPSPYLRMRYDNTRTGAGSIGPGRGFTTVDVLLREMRLLEGAEGSFVECENVGGNVCRIGWHGDWVVQGDSGVERLKGNALEAWTRVFLDCP